MTDLHESIRSAIARTRTERELPANVLAAIGEAGYVLVSQDDDLGLLMQQCRDDGIIVRIENTGEFRGHPFHANAERKTKRYPVHVWHCGKTPIDALRTALGDLDPSAEG